MVDLCHRCQAELPEPPLHAESPLFCPHCSAPQIMLPEHLRVEIAAPQPEGVTAPPPANENVPWREILPTAAWVAAVGGLLSVLSFKSGFIDALSPLWVLASGSVVLGVALRRRPAARMDGLSGWRIGLVTGLLMVGAKGAGISVTGVVARFATQSMVAYDVQSARDAQNGKAMMLSLLPAEKDDRSFNESYNRLLASPEVRAGSMLGGAAVQSLFVVFFAGLGGFFAGAVERRRRLAAARG